MTPQRFYEISPETPTPLDSPVLVVGGYTRFTKHSGAPPEPTPTKSSDEAPSDSEPSTEE